MTYSEAEKLKETFKDDSILTHYPYCPVRENLYIVPFQKKDYDAYMKKWIAFNQEGKEIEDAMAKYYSQDDEYDVQLIYNDPNKESFILKEWADTINEIHKKD